MKKHITNRTRTLLFVSLAAAAMGTASAGVLEVGRISPVPATAGNVAYNFAIANHGAGQVSDLRVFLDGLNAVTCSSTTAQGQAFAQFGALGAGDSVQCTGLSLAINGNSDASITVLAQGHRGMPIHETAHATSAMLGAPVPSQSIVGMLLGAVVNDADSDNAFDPGDSIDYSYTVFNFGNTPLTGLVVTDNLGTTITCPQTTLAVGESFVCTGTYVASGPGVVINTATVNGTGPGGEAVSTIDSAIRTGSGASEIRALKNPLFAQDVDGNGVAGIGDVVEYTFALKNSGSLPLDPVNITETDPSRIDGTITCDATTIGGNPFSGLGTGALPLGDTVLCSASYTIAQIDVDIGEADNNVTISGQPPFGGSASGSAASAFVIPAAPPPAPHLPVPANDWRAMLLLGLGLLAVAFAATRRKRQNG